MERIGTFGDSGYRIEDIQLFRGVNDPMLAKLIAPCVVTRLSAGLSVPDGTRGRLLVVLKGALAVAADTRTGFTDGTVSKVLPGESVGEQSVLDDAADLVAVNALDDTELLIIPAETVWRLIDESNGVARNLLRLLSFRIAAANAQMRRRQKVGEFYRQMSLVDGLTGLYNRAWLNDKLPSLIAQAHETGQALALIMVDLDHFKRFNDTHGHLGGDQALRTAAKAISGALRPSDFAVRYGGEEIMVLLPETNDNLGLMVAARLCERLRQAVVFPDMRIPMPQITASFGLASLQAGQDEHGLVSAADEALYRAKEGGRNRVSQ